MKKTIRLFSTLLGLCLLFVAVQGLQAQTQSWVYAGNPGQQGYTGDGYLAYQSGTTSNPVSFIYPIGLSFDGSMESCTFTFSSLGSSTTDLSDLITRPAIMPLLRF